jgi:spore coat protein A, manganese oxidase
MKRISACLTVALGMLFVFSSLISASAFANQQILQTPLPGKNITKYAEPLPTFVGARVTATNLTVSMEEFQQKVLPASFYNALPAPFMNGTYVWGYKVNGAGPKYPAFTIEAQQGVPTTASYLNNLIKPDGAPPELQKYLSVDQTFHWADPLGLMCEFYPTQPECYTPYGYPTWPGAALANPQPAGAPVPAVTHLHGAEVASAFDGGPDTWFTPGLSRTGPGFVSNVYTYPNAQEAATLWFHDHALGTTRLNVYGGLAGFYFLRDARDTGLPANPIALPAGSQEIELAIQDRTFDTNGQWYFPDTGVNPSVHPFWVPEFFGDTIVVNGKTWPYLNVEPRRYRLRLLNGSNARFYNIALFDQKHNVPGPAFWQIGTDGGLLDTPVKIAWPNRLTLAPGERADIVVDFSNLPRNVGPTFTLVNDAKAPFPAGAPADPQTVGEIMQFRVALNLAGADTTCNPAVAGACNLRGTNPIVRLADPMAGTLAPGVTPSVRRQLILDEVAGPGGPLEVLLNNTKWNGLKESTVGISGVTPQPVAASFPASYSGTMGPNWLTEGPRVGATEVWEIINLTADAHPIHVHLVQFQLINRQMFASKYISDWMAAFSGGVFLPGDGPPLAYTTVNADGAIGGNPALSPYLQDGILPPNPNEAGWKDTVIMLPGQVTRIAVRWAPQRIPVAAVVAGQNLYPFDPTEGPGYVWHCHILEHEDNEMMRPYLVSP